MTDFSMLELPPAQQKNLRDLGYLKMTPVQMAALPTALAGVDQMIQAETGSGKTVAFGLPGLQKINPRDFSTQTLVMCPTRELAAQVAVEIRRLARFQANLKVVVLCGGVPIGPQIGSLEHGAHVVVGTPGRLLDHLRKGTLVLPRLSVLVLDEADRMLDMGFGETVLDIITKMPKTRQTILCSATLPDDIERMSRHIQQQPERITVESSQDPKITEIFVRVDKGMKSEALLGLLQTHQPEAVVVFCQTRKGVAQLADAVNASGMRALALHGDLDQRQRDDVLLRFRHGSVRMLIATDVAARGLDIAALPMVINFDLPHDSETYIHRIGRTGRAEADGVALSLFETSEKFKIERLQAELSSEITPITAPNYRPDAIVLPPAEFRTLELSLGRKDKIRAGDILGAITGSLGFPSDIVGKIEIKDRAAFVSIHKSRAHDVFKALGNGTVKRRRPKVRMY